MASKTEFRRLPNNVVPQDYMITLEPNLKTSTFHGFVRIVVKIVEPTKNIIMNVAQLRLNVVTVSYGEAKMVKPVYSTSEVHETLCLQFKEVLDVGEAVIAIDYSGELNDKMKGFYRSKVATPGVELEYSAVTQFASTYARYCFPCWDEPALKATFTVILNGIGSDLVALSNMPVEHETLKEGGIRLVKFRPTPIMSTYLLAFVVGAYDYVEGKTSDFVLVRVYTPPGKKESGRFALDVATRVLPYYKEYFNIAYPLRKMDMIAIQEMSVGAMENWGLVMYKENYLLVDENSSALTKQNVALTVGHEIAHQWFGNLVTMEWWTHLWLNEGYASFVQYLCVEHLFPEYNIWSQFVTDMYVPALKLDALSNSHPIEVPVGPPSEVEEIFDDISYNKGASIIRMMHKYIGDKDFRAGMHLYLTRHQYGNATTDNLWSALETASGKPVGKIMSSYTKQKGFPVVEITEVTQKDESRTFHISQKKFVMNSKDSDDTLWSIPLSFSSTRCPDGECISIIFDGKSCQVRVPNVGPFDWVKANPGMVGFYRTKYPPELLIHFKTAIELKSLPVLDRLGILDDCFALAQAGFAKTTDTLELLLAMTQEEEYNVICTMASTLQKLNYLLADTNFQHLFHAYALKIIRPMYRKLGHEPKIGEGHLTTLSRSLVLNLMVKFGGKEFVDAALKKFKEHCEGVAVIPADLRAVYYKAWLAGGGRKAYKDILKLYRKADVQEEKDRLCRAFSAVRHKCSLDKFLRFAFSQEVIAQRTVTCLAAAASSKIGRDHVWNLVKRKWHRIRRKYSGGFLLPNIVKYSTEYFTSLEKATEVEDFFKAVNCSGVERRVQQSLEMIRINAAWLQRDQAHLKAFLEHQK